MYGEVNNNWSQSIGGSELSYGSGLRTVADVGVAQGGNLLNIAPTAIVPQAHSDGRTAVIENERLAAQANKVHKAKSAVRIMSHPVESAFRSIAAFVQRKKRLRNDKFAATLPEIARRLKA